MAAKPTHRELEQKIKALELELGDCKQTITMAFESANLLQKAIDRALVMVWTVDQKGMLSSMAGAGLIGLESRPDQVLGQPISDVFMDYPKIMADTQQALAEEEFFFHHGPQRLHPRMSLWTTSRPERESGRRHRRGKRRDQTGAK